MDTRRDIASFLAAQTAKGRSFYAAFARSLFLNNINPRQPAPGPDHGILIKGAQNLGTPLWWEHHHGGARRFHALQWHPAEWREHEGEPVLIQPGFAHSNTSTLLIPACRPPSRAKPRHLDQFKLLCHAEAFVDAVRRGIKAGVI